MCLKTITKRFKCNSNMKVGYKLFRRGAYDGRESYRNIYFNTYTTLRMGKAYIAKSHTYEINTRDGRYKPFFHIFEDLSEAIEYIRDCVYPGNIVVCEVFAWDIRTFGIHDGRECFVAKSYRIMREVHRSTLNKEVKNVS